MITTEKFLRSPISHPNISQGNSCRIGFKEGGAECVTDSPGALRVAHANQLRSFLLGFTAECDLEDHLDRSGQAETYYVEGSIAKCALSADPGPVIAAALLRLDTALEHVDAAEVAHG